jgi:putative glutamine amidotransferase
VRSYHHQGVDRVGRRLVATGWADDGTVEVLEHADRPFVLGVLWHPEEGEDAALFAGLVEAAATAV